MKILMGTSGWSYEEWVGILYPSSNTPKLKYYSSIFDTAEVDSSFYAMPSSKVVLGWIKNTPEGFKFSLKIPKSITHDMKLEVTDRLESELSTFLKIIAPLYNSGKLGSLLLQLPPSLEFSIDRLERFINLLPTKEIRFAVEFRNLSWLRSETWDILKKKGVAYTIVDEPLLPNDIIVTADHCYIRWHGHGKAVWYDYRYSEQELEEWAKKLKNIRADEIYAYWNNHFHGFAVLNCLEQLKRLGLLDQKKEEVLANIKRKIDAPKTLFDFSGA